MKYFTLFCIPAATMADWMSKMPESERKAQSDQMMQEWQKWMDKVGAKLVDRGMPLGKTKRVTATGVTDVKNDLTYYIILEADTHEQAVEMLRDNPHTQIPDGYIEVMEISRTGM